MSVTITQEYTVPTTGLKSTASITLDVTKGRLSTDTSDAKERMLLKATASGKDTVYIDIDKVAQDALSGRPGSAHDGNKETYSTAATVAGATTISVLSDDDFTAGDPVAVMDDYDATNVEFMMVTASTNNVLTLTKDASGTGMTYAHKKNSIIQNLKLRYMANSLGSGMVPGIKTQYERAAAVTGMVATSPGVSKGADILFTETSGSRVAAYYDIYASRVRLTSIPENRIPDYSDATYSGSKFNLTTYTESNNVAHTLQAGKKFWFYVVPKTGVGQRDITEGVAAEKSLVVL